MGKVTIGGIEIIDHEANMVPAAGKTIRERRLLGIEEE